MIQEIAPKKLNNQYIPSKRPCAQSAVLHFQGRRFLCRLEESKEGSEAALQAASLRASACRTVIFPRYEELYEALGLDKGRVLSVNTEEPGLSYLFSVDGEDYFLLRTKEALELEGFSYEDINVFRECFPLDRAYALSTAYHLNNWYESERFCGRCGTPLVHDGAERMMKCPKCGNMIFPRINPCVIVGVISGDRILCTRYNRPGAGNFALVAGFCEIGETIEETVYREVMEEVGIKVKRLTFYKSQPWAMSSSLLCGFLCELDGGDAHADGIELASARWYSRDELKECYTPSHIALTSHIITAFMNGEIGLWSLKD